MAISVFKPGGGASDFEFPATDGTAGQALVTNGAGALSFATMSLPDGAIIGGVMYFNRPTKPTERSAGVPLVVRDRWYKTDVGTEWFFNGTYWLSCIEYELCTVAANNISATTNHGIVKGASTVITSEGNASGQLNAFITRCLLHSRELIVNDENNYWSNALGSQNGFGSSPALAPLPSSVTTIDAVTQGGLGRRKNTPINSLATAIPYNITAMTTKVGSPSNLIAHFIYLYRSVYI